MRESTNSNNPFKGKNSSLLYDLYYAIGKGNSNYAGKG